MDLGLNGKTALITGGSKGIGLAVAKSLAGEGCNVHLVSRTRTDLEKAQGDIRAAHNVAVSIHAHDLSDSSCIPDLLAATGTPDILVNNAGAIPGGDLQKVDEPIWRNAWDLKVFGYINMARATYAAMKERGNGVIINVTGLAADRPDFNYVAGTTGNAGLNAFTRAVGGYSLEDGIRLLSVSPGAVTTERLVTLMKTRAKADLGTEDRWQELLAGLPLKRAAHVEEVADVVVFAASERASYISGTIITVDGGHGSRGGSFS